jgi:hypothetical protein
MRQLKTLNMRGCGSLRDLRPLENVPLTSLDVSLCFQVSDLTPLKKMPLTDLQCFSTGALKDLSPLRGLPLVKLNLAGTSTSDLTPLDGMNLEEIAFIPKQITRGMDVVRRMKSLKFIDLSNNARFPPAEFWKRYDAGEFK